MGRPAFNWAAIDADPRFQELHKKRSAFLWGLMIFSIAYYFLLQIGAAYWLHVAARETAHRPLHPLAGPAVRPTRSVSMASRCITNPESSTTHSSDPSRGDTARSALNDFIVPNVTAAPRSTGYSYGTGVSRR